MNHAKPVPNIALPFLSQGGSHQPDDVQREAVSRLDTIYQELQNKPSVAPQTGGGLRAKFGKLLGKRDPVTETVTVRGLYMWAASAEENPVDGSVLSKSAGRT